MTFLTNILHSTYFHGALVGLCGAIGPDLHAFLAWKSVGDAKTFQWKTAALHYAQGIVGGLIATPLLASLFGI